MNVSYDTSGSIPFGINGSFTINLAVIGTAHNTSICVQMPYNTTGSRTVHSSVVGTFLYVTIATSCNAAYSIGTGDSTRSSTVGNRREVAIKACSISHASYYTTYAMVTFNCSITKTAIGNLSCIIACIQLANQSAHHLRVCTQSQAFHCTIGYMAIAEIGF